MEPPDPGLGMPTCTCSHCTRKHPNGRPFPSQTHLRAHQLRAPCEHSSSNPSFVEQPSEAIEREVFAAALSGEDEPHEHLDPLWTSRTSRRSTQEESRPPRPALDIGSLTNSFARLHTARPESHIETKRRGRLKDIQKHIERLTTLLQRDPLSPASRATAHNEIKQLRDSLRSIPNSDNDNLRETVSLHLDKLESHLDATDALVPDNGPPTFSSGMLKLIHSTYWH